MKTKRNTRFINSIHIKKCPVCLNMSSNKIYTEMSSIRLKDDILQFKRSLSICRNCETVYTSDILPKSVMYDIYFTGIINASVTSNENVNSDRYNFIINNLPMHKNMTMCEIGCNTGDFLLLFNHNGYNLYGVELSSVASKICSDRLPEANILNGDWNETQFIDKFEFISAIHTLEHSFEPLKFIKKCHKALKKNGTLFIEIPTFNDKSHPSINPYNQSHTVCFSTNSIIYLLNSQGFYINRIEELKSKRFESTLRILATKTSLYEFIKDEHIISELYKRELVRYITDILIRWSTEKKKIYLYGAGNNAIDILLSIDEDSWKKINICSFLDNDEKKIGSKIFDIPVLKIGNNIAPDCVMILSKIGIEMNMYKHIKECYPKVEICTPYTTAYERSSLFQ